MRMEDPDQSNSTCGAGPESPYICGSGNHSDEGLDLSNERLNSHNSNGPTEQRTDCQVDGKQSEPNDPLEGIQDGSVKCKSHLELDLLFQRHRLPETDISRTTVPHQESSSVTNNYSHQTNYTSNHLTYATHTIHSHLFGVSSWLWFPFGNDKKDFRLPCHYSLIHTGNNVDSTCVLSVLSLTDLPNKVGAVTVAIEQMYWNCFETTRQDI